MGSILAVGNRTAEGRRAADAQPALAAHERAQHNEHLDWECQGHGDQKGKQADQCRKLAPAGSLGQEGQSAPGQSMADHALTISFW